MLRNIDQPPGSAKQMHTSTYGTHSKATEHHIHVRMVRFEGYKAGKGNISYKDMYRSGGKSGEPDICLFAKAESMHMVTLHHPSDGLFYFIFSYFHFECTRIFDQNTSQRSKGSGEPVEGFYRIKSPLASRGGSSGEAVEYIAIQTLEAHRSGSNQSLLVIYTSQYHYTLLYTSFELVFDLLRLQHLSKRQYCVRPLFEATSKPRNSFEPRPRGSITFVGVYPALKPFAALRRSDLCTRTHPTYLVSPISLVTHSLRASHSFPSLSIIFVECFASSDRFS